MSANVEFFAPSDGLSLGGAWEIQNASETQTRNRAAALGAGGDELPSTVKEFGGTKSVTFNYVCKLATGYVTLPKLGATTGANGGYHIDNFTATYNQQGALTLSVTAHKHGNAGAAHDQTRTYTASVKLPARVLGIPSKITDGAGTPATLFELLSTSGKGMRALAYSFSVNHVDEDDGDAEHLAGNDYDATETLTGEITGNAAPTTDYTIAGAAADGTDAGWISTSAGVSPNNTGATTTSFTLEHHVAHD